ncbi:kinase-like domain-containing protein [Delphinella strobiligena]|nr:kinase-like domain-containing protein [Delphinella strobiligena]
MDDATVAAHSVPRNLSSLSESVNRRNTTTWNIGSKIMLSTAAPSPDAVCRWTEGNREYSLRLLTHESPICGSDNAAGLDLVQPVYRGEQMESHGVWFIGNSAVLKAKPWLQNMELESDTISFVNKCFPDVPTPTVIHSWIDQQHQRSFILMSRCAGDTLLHQWPLLSNDVRNIAARNVAEICKKLAYLQSARFESPTGRGVFEPMLYPSVKLTKPVGPFSAEEFDAYFSSPTVRTPESVKMGKDRFVFYHPDLNPGNILLSKNGHVTAIIDWDGAGYYPPWYIATKVGSFGFQIDSDSDAHRWQRLLISQLVIAGFHFNTDFWDWYIDWMESKPLLHGD